jgi:CHAT domain-containing protein
MAKRKRNKLTKPTEYQKFQNIISEADKKVDEKERSQDLASKCAGLYQKFANCTYDNKQFIQFGVFLRVMNKETVDIPLLFFSVAQDKVLCKKLEDNKLKISNKLARYEYKRAKELLEYADQSKDIKKYTNRHRLVERAMLQMFPYVQGIEKWQIEDIQIAEINDFIAKCYLIRSRLALQKGAAIPEKKLEAIDKALKWSEKGSDKNLFIEIVLEKDRWALYTDPNWLKDAIAKFLKSTTIDFTIPIHWTVCNKARLVGIDFNDNTKIDQQMLTHPLSIIQDDSHYYPLYQAEAAFRLKDTKMFKEKLSFAVKHLEAHLGSPLWQDMISLIKKASSDNHFAGAWEKAAIDAWVKSKKAESRLKLSIQVRWYWSKSKDIYDLALLAAIQKEKPNPQLALLIADSQKNRPSIKLQHIEKHFTDKDDIDMIHHHLEVDALFATKNFSAGMDRLKELTSKTSNKCRSVMNVLKNQAAVHFYIINNACAFALIVQDKQCHYKEIEIEKIWNAFQIWEHDRINIGLEDDPDPVIEAFENLCMACGTMLDPIIKEIQSNQIIFIPHGFLHLVPLHCAKINGQYLFQTHLCTFLPAWSVAPIKHLTVPDHGKIFLSKDEKNEGPWDNEKTKENSPSEVIDILNNNDSPNLLVIYCHGEGEYVNPYQSRLKLYGGPLTHHEVIQKVKPKALSGTRVMLTACETDLVNRKFEIVDEHLSLANAFLRKGASEVLGTLFECDNHMSDELIEETRKTTEMSLCKILQTKQKEWLENNKSILSISPYRITGF